MQKEFYDAMFQIEQTHWWYQGKQKIVQTLLDKHLPVPAGGNSICLLDVGCGCGLMLNVLQTYGKVEGMDYSDVAIEYCRESFSGPLYQWDLNHPLVFEHAFDGIIALDVLEHIADDNTAIHTLANALAPGGTMIITVPANPWMWSEHDLGCMHQRRYTKKSLENLCKSSGLTIDYLSYYNFWLFPPIACVRLLEKAFKFGATERKKERKKESLENQLPSPIMNSLLFRVFQSEHKMILRNAVFPFGVSLIGVLKKPIANKG